MEDSRRLSYRAHAQMFTCYEMKDLLFNAGRLINCNTFKARTEKELLDLAIEIMKKYKRINYFLICFNGYPILFEKTETELYSPNFPCPNCGNYVELKLDLQGGALAINCLRCKAR